MVAPVSPQGLAWFTVEMVLGWLWQRKKRGSFLLRWLRAWLDGRAQRHVLVLGDSHVRVFEHWWFMLRLPQVRWEVVYVAGGTATGLYNPKAVTQTHAKLTGALQGSTCELVLLNLGEVDTGYTIWVRAQAGKLNVEQALGQSVQRYLQFIDEIRQHKPLVVLSAPLPTLPDDFDPEADDVLTRRKSVLKTQRERTAMTLAFNEQVAAACQARGVPYLDDRSASLGAQGLVRAEWLRRDGRMDHHYDRRVYAVWLCQSLKALLDQSASTPVTPD